MLLIFQMCRFIKKVILVFQYFKSVTNEVTDRSTNKFLYKFIFANAAYQMVKH